DPAGRRGRVGLLSQPRGEGPARGAGPGGRRVRRARRVDPLDGAGGPGRRGQPHLHHPPRPRGRRAGHAAGPRRPRRGGPHRLRAARGRRGLTAPPTMLRYVSTRGGAPALDFADVLLAGLAVDGGLYVPERWPELPPGCLDADRPYADVAV